MSLAALAVILLIVFFFPAAMFFAGPWGHCFPSGPKCQAEEAALSALWGQELLGLLVYPFVAVFLIAASFRSRRAAVALAALSTVVVMAGLVPILAGFWKIEPDIAGVSVPLITPGFTFWIPAAIAMLLLAWRNA